MEKRLTIPVHTMNDWFAGIYLKPMSANFSSSHGYERSEPHRHDFYYCVLLEQGLMELEVDINRVKLADQSLFFSYPGQVHRITDLRSIKGWFLAFDPNKIEEPLRNVLDQFLTEIVTLKMSPEVTNQFDTVLEQLYLVYQDQKQLYRVEAITSLLTAFVYRLASAYLIVEGFKLSKHTERNIAITKRFRQLLRQCYRSLKRPNDYASKLNITVSHLNDTVKEVTGFPVTYHIQRELIQEAQRLLHYSDLSVKEISASLGFEDARYFSRLFSKVTGISPRWFRRTKAL